MQGKTSISVFLCHLPAEHCTFPNSFYETARNAVFTVFTDTATGLDAAISKKQ